MFLSGKSGSGLVGQFYRAQKCGVSACWIEADFGISHARDLVARGLDALGAGFDVGAMHRNDLFRCVFENVGRPEGAVDVGPEIFEFRGHAAVENMDVAENRIAASDEISHES